VLQSGQEQIEDLLLQVVVDHPGAELGQDAEVEARIVQTQAQGIGPGQLVPRGLGRLPVGEVLGHLKDRDQSQTAR
jgi:hypothetical protein